MRCRIKSSLLPLVSLGVVLGALAPANAASSAGLNGGILGIVTDSAGVARMGASVILLNQFEKIVDRALTDEKGAFSFQNLSPGLYSLRVSLSSFLPALRNGIDVRAGANSLLDVSLAGLFSSIELVYQGPERRAIMSDDWKWVLRTSNATRPVLRFLPGIDISDPAKNRREGTALFHDTRGVLRVSGGDGARVSSMGSESDLGTAFALATSLYGTNQLQFTGNLAYSSQSGLPSAGFRTSYSRNMGSGSPEVTVMMRQLFLPGRFGMGLIGGGGASSSVPALRTMTIALHDRTQLTDALQLEYGFSLDSVTFLDRLNYFSPFARATYALSEDGQLELTYTSGVPRSDWAPHNAGREDQLQAEMNALSLFPRLSLRAGRARVQRGDNLEFGYSQRIGSRSFRVGAYQERITNAALTFVGPADFFSSGEILPDLFSRRSVFNAGDYKSFGYLMSATQQMGDSLSLTLMYGSGQALTPEAREIAGQDPDDSRSLIRASRRHAVTLRAAGSAPRTNTQFMASYQWMDAHAATPGHIYSTQGTRAEPGLNCYLRQPIPAFSSMPWRMEATADLRNLLEQGYLPLSAAGRRFVLVQTPRSFRGGLSFIF